MQYNTWKRLPILAASNISQTFGYQPQLLFVEPAVCNSVSQIQGLSLLLHRRKTQVTSSSIYGSPFVHKHTIWFKAVLQGILKSLPVTVAPKTTR